MFDAKIFAEVVSKGVNQLYCPDTFIKIPSFLKEIFVGSIEARYLILKVVSNQPRVVLQDKERRLQNI